MKKETKTLVVGEETFTFETGKIARQANGAVVIRAGDTIVFSTACAAKEPKEGIDFLPLQVFYQEKFSSAGKTVGGFIKREGRPTEREILIARLIDRPLRPMFEDGYRKETQVLSYVWSYDGTNAPEPLAITGASIALAISDIPLIKPVAGVRVGLIEGKFVLNPTVQHQKESSLDLIIAGTEDGILMIEGYADFLTEEQVLKAIEVGSEGIKTICHFITQWAKEIGKEKDLSSIKKLSEDCVRLVEGRVAKSIAEAMKIHDKKEREKVLSEVEEKLLEELFPSENSEVAEFSPDDVKSALKKVRSKQMRQMILNEKIRIDGRQLNEVRPINIEQGVLPRVHGSSLFTRGETQVLAVCTLGGESMAQRFEDLDGEGARKFYMQYFFPPFSVGEVGRAGPPGRREIGHGKLAERSLAATLPDEERFPYTIRLESNVTESNGSSSMASVCGGNLAMMDAGVPIKSPVSGIAMGLVLEENNYAVLSDILGIEDALGDMDFKITGDRNGITAFQMDIKVEGITIDIMEKALQQAKEGRIHILDKMVEACPKPKSEMSVYAPRIERIKIKPSKIAAVIGPGGKQIREIIESTGVDINIDDEGWISVVSPDLEGIEKAKQAIYGITAEPEIGKVYTGKITSVVAFGLFVEILPGREGLCHISEFDTKRIEQLTDYVKVGDSITVKLLDINDRGQLKLSRKVLLLKK